MCWGHNWRGHFFIGIIQHFLQLIIEQQWRRTHGGATMCGLLRCTYYTPRALVLLGSSQRFIFLLLDLSLDIHYIFFFIKSLSQHSWKFLWPLFLGFRPFNWQILLNLSIKSSEAKKQRPHKLLWMLWFDEKVYLMFLGFSYKMKIIVGNFYMITLIRHHKLCSCLWQAIALIGVIFL